MDWQPGKISIAVDEPSIYTIYWTIYHLVRAYVILKSHHKQDIFVTTRGRGVNNKDILQVHASGHVCMCSVNSFMY